MTREELSALISESFHVPREGNIVKGRILEIRPQVVLVETAGNYTLLGDPQAITPADLQPHLKGFVDTTEAFAPLLKLAYPEVKPWQRVVFVQPDHSEPVAAGDYSLRRLAPSDS